MTDHISPHRAPGIPTCNACGRTWPCDTWADQSPDHRRATTIYRATDYDTAMMANDIWSTMRTLSRHPDLTTANDNPTRTLLLAIHDHLGGSSRSGTIYALSLLRYGLNPLTLAQAAAITTVTDRLTALGHHVHTHHTHATTTSGIHIAVNPLIHGEEPPSPFIAAHLVHDTRPGGVHVAPVDDADALTHLADAIHDQAQHPRFATFTDREIESQRSTDRPDTTTRG